MSNASTLALPGKQADAIKAVLEALGLRGGDALRVLRRVAEEVGPASTAQDAFERVRLRSIGVEDEILVEEGGAVSDAELARRLGVRSRQTVHNYREAGKLFAVPKGARQLVYPSWQVHEGALLPGLAEVLAKLKEHRVSPMGTMLFFLTPAEALQDARPLDRLRQGAIDEVVQHTERYDQLGS